MHVRISTWCLLWLCLRAEWTEWAASLSQKKTEKKTEKKTGVLFPWEKTSSPNTRAIFAFTFWHYGHHLRGVSFALAVVFLLCSQSSELHYRTLTRPGTSPSFSGSVLVSTPASQGLFFSLFLPPSTPSHPLFPKIASPICKRQRSRRGGRPSFSFPSLSLSMCFCSLHPTVSHPRSSPCNWFYISDKQSTALKRSCLCARRPAWIVITLCSEWAWGLFGL